MPQHAEAPGFVQRGPQLGVVEGVGAKPRRAALIRRGPFAAPHAARVTRPQLLMLLLLRRQRGGPFPLPLPQARLRGRCVVRGRIDLMGRSCPAASLTGSRRPPRPRLLLLLRMRRLRACLGCAPRGQQCARPIVWVRVTGLAPPSGLTSSVVTLRCICTCYARHPLFGVTTSKTAAAPHPCSSCMQCQHREHTEPTDDAAPSTGYLMLPGCPVSQPSIVILTTGYCCQGECSSSGPCSAVLRLPPLPRCSCRS